MELLGTGKQRAGTASRISVGASNLKYSKFDVSDETNDLDTVNFESGVYEEGIMSLKGAKGSFGGAWDAGANPYEATPGIYPRDDLATVKFYNSVADNQFWSFPYMRIRSNRNGSEVRGLVTFEVGNCMSQGLFYRPAGNA